MFDKRSRPAIGRPAIGKLAGIVTSGIVDTMTSPRSPLDFNMLQSPRGLKSTNYYNQDEGIGLGIVVALDNKSSTCNLGCSGEILAKYAICSQFLNRSNPINVTPSRKIKNERKNHNHMLGHEEDEMMEGFEEEFTYATCSGPNKSTSRVYYSGDEYGQQAIGAKKVGVFNISSPARFSVDCSLDSDFLSSCHSCRKDLHGKDIYMYRGEKAFCSAECRQRQIRIDEKKKRCRSEASRSGELTVTLVEARSSQLGL